MLQGRMVRVGYIDALRGVAILAVLLVHVGQASHVAGVLGYLTAYGARGVQLFYITSALTMLTICKPGMDVGAFFVRRFFRIAPMFYFAGLLYLALDGMGPRYYAPFGLHALDVLLPFVFLHGWRPTAVNGLINGGWSVACEMMFYLSFPVLLATVTTFRRSILFLICSLVVAVATIKVGPLFVKGNLANDWLFFSVLAQLPAFACGFVVYFALETFGERAMRFTPWGLTGVVVLMAGLAASGRDHYLISTLLLAVFVFGVGACKPPVLVNRAVQSVGLVSFSVYLLHHAVLDRLTLPWPPTINLVGFYALTLALTLGAASLTYRYVEQPMIAVGRRLLEQRTVELRRAA